MIGKLLRHTWPRSQKSIDRALEFLRSRLEELDDRIDVEAVDKDDFAELFKSCYLSIADGRKSDRYQHGVS